MIELNLPITEMKSMTILTDIKDFKKGDYIKDIITGVISEVVAVGRERIVITDKDREFITIFLPAYNKHIQAHRENKYYRLHHALVKSSAEEHFLEEL